METRGVIKVVVLAVTVVLISCSRGLTQDIKTQAVVDPHASFSNISTYGWYGAAEVLNDPQEMWTPGAVDPGAEIKFLIDEKLRNRGWSESPTPEVLIAFLVVNEVKDLAVIEDERAGNVPDLVGVGEGALLVEVIDANTRTSMWIGAATAETRTGRPADDVKARLKYAVDHLFSQLPH